MLTRVVIIISIQLTGFARNPVNKTTSLNRGKFKCSEAAFKNAGSTGGKESVKGTKYMYAD